MPEPIQSPLADIFTAENVARGEYHGALLPAHFSNAAEENQACRKSAGLFDFSFRRRFALQGPDRVRYLHRVVSNDVKQLTPGSGIYSTLLTAQGQIVADFLILCEEDALVIETDADLREKTAQALQKYIIGDKVQIELLDDVAVSIQGPRSRSFVEGILGTSLPDLVELAHTSVQFEKSTVRVMRASSTGEEGYELWTVAEIVKTLWQKAHAQEGLTCCGSEALETLRIEAGIPRYGIDLGEDTLPLEAGLLKALSFNKGCYIGQEIVERARSRGHVNWKLIGLLVDTPQAAAVGEKLLAAEKEVGEVTSACFSPTLNRTIALAYVRREFSEPGTKLVLASGTAVEVSTLPFHRRAETPKN